MSGAKPPHQIESAHLEALAPMIWRRRRIETYRIKSVQPDWHPTQPWWNKVTSTVPKRRGLTRMARGPVRLKSAR